MGGGWPSWAERPELASRRQRERNCSCLQEQQRPFSAKRQRGHRKKTGDLVIKAIFFRQTVNDAVLCRLIFTKPRHPRPSFPRVTANNSSTLHAPATFIRGASAFSSPPLLKKHHRRKREDNGNANNKNLNIFKESNSVVYKT